MSAKVLLTILAAGLMAAQAPAPRVIPNDPYFKYQISFLNLGGTLTIERMSTKASPQAFEATAGIDADVTRAWTISTGSKAVTVAILDDSFFYSPPLISRDP